MTIPCDLKCRTCNYQSSDKITFKEHSRSHINNQTFEILSGFLGHIRQKVEQIDLFISPSVRDAVDNYADAKSPSYGDAEILISTIGRTERLSSFAKELCNQKEMCEIHIHQALVTLILAARRDKDAFKLLTELAVEPTNTNNQRKWLDLAFTVPGHNIAYAIELECIARPKKKDSKHSRKVRNQLAHGLDQLINDYESFLKNHNDNVDRRYMCVVFDKEGRLLVYNRGLRIQEAKNLRMGIFEQSNQEQDDNLVWVY
jgi:hypothetical protein